MSSLHPHCTSIHANGFSPVGEHVENKPFNVRPVHVLVTHDHKTAVPEIIEIIEIGLLEGREQ